MANKTIGMLRLKQLFKLKAEGNSARSIGRLLKINRETVGHYINQAIKLGLDFGVVEKMQEEELQVLFSSVKQPKPKDSTKIETLAGWFPYLQKELSRTGVDLKLQGMYRFQTALELRNHESLTADQLISMLVEAEYNHRRNLNVKTNMHRARFRYRLLWRT